MTFTCTLLLAATPALAQTRTQTDVYAATGVTFGTETGFPLLTGSASQITDTIGVFGEFGRLSNVLPSNVRDVIDAVLSIIELESGVSSALSVKVPATYGLGGIRINGDRRSKIMPFGEVGIGIARLEVDLSLEVAGVDFTSVIGLLDLQSESALITTAGGGVNVLLNPMVSLDLGFRVNRLFADAGGVNVGQAYGAVRIGF